MAGSARPAKRKETRGLIQTCACGNVLARPDVVVGRMRVSPCRCAKPSSGSSFFEVGYPDELTLEHVTERRRTGLPMLTDVERAQFGRWT